MEREAREGFRRAGIVGSRSLESDSDCKSRAGMEGEGEGGLVDGGGIGLGDEH